MKKKYIMALDQGTSSSKALIFDDKSELICQSSVEFKQIYPRSGWIEHDPEEIWGSQKQAMKEVVQKAGIMPEEIVSIGITNQRETVVLWDRKTGKPVYNAIVWQCRRTAELCSQLKKEGIDKVIRQKTGLLIDAYFSAAKIKWILDNVKDIRDEAERGNIYAGTIDSWLIWKLTQGRIHATDSSNASRTMIYDIHKLQWDRELMKIFDIPMQILPEVKPSSYIYGVTNKDILGREIPIAAAAGDQQAALFGQACFEPGMAKCTYGTGCFLLRNTGDEIVSSNNDLLSTIAWRLGEKVVYAQEGSIFVAGAAIQWLRDELGIIQRADECDVHAGRVADSGGVYFVPAFVGLGAPYWDMYARGSLFGLTRGTTREHLIRAALEAIAYQVRDVILVMQKDSDMAFKVMKVDGGASASNILMQFQADILGVEVCRPNVREITAQGAVFLAGLASGVWTGTDAVSKICKDCRIFKRNMDEEKVSKLCEGWDRAVGRTLGWLER
jgi:glycerol kinase